MKLRDLTTCFLSLLVHGAVGCGASGEGRSDAGPDTTNAREDAAAEAAARDAAHDARTKDAPQADALGDAAAPPVGKQLATGNDPLLYGVTSDGFAIYADDGRADAGNNPTFFAVSLSGGAPSGGPPVRLFVAPGTDNFARTSGAAFVLVTGVHGPEGTLEVWTKAGGAHRLASATPGPVFAVSDDASYVAFLDDHDVTTGKCAFYVTKSDGTGRTKLASGVVGYGTTCAPQIAFQGSYALLAACSKVTDGTGALTAYEAPGFTATVVGSKVNPSITLDPTGVSVLFSSNAGLETTQLGSGTITTIDPAGTSGLFTSDGGSVLYTSPSGLSRWDAASPSKTTLLAAEPKGLYALSPNDATALVYEHVDPVTGFTDLFAASASAPGAVTSLSTGKALAIGGPSVHSPPGGQPGWAFGDAFTNDSSSALFWSNISLMTDIGDFEVAPLSVAPGARRLGMGGNTAYATGASTIVFADHFVSRAVPARLEDRTTMDIEWLDTTSPDGRPTRLVTQASGGPLSDFSPAFFLSPGKNELVYTWAVAPGPLAGVWLLGVP